jgi:periplasmic protein TonB
MNLPVNDQDASTAHNIIVPGPTASRPTRERNSSLRYGTALVVIAGLFGVAVFFLVGHDDMPPPRQVRELTVVNIVPPPPPPPPPPPMPEQKMIEQPKMAEPELKEEKQVETPKDEPSKEAKTDLPPEKPGLDAPVGPNGSFPKGGGGGGGGGGGSRWGWYASIVQVQIEAALRANSRTRNATMQVQIRLWADASGRVNRIQLVSSTGDAELDAVIRNDVLGSLVLREPPPKDMPMPMVTRVTARRPS